MKPFRSLLCLPFVLAAVAACSNQPDTALPAPLPASTTGTGITGATGMAGGTGLSGGTGTPSSPAGTGGSVQ